MNLSICHKCNAPLPLHWSGCPNEPFVIDNSLFYRDPPVQDPDDIDDDIDIKFPERGSR